MLPGCTLSFEPPTAVSQAFAARYPHISPTWQKQPYGYEGLFSSNGIEYEAEFSLDGQWLETEHEVSAAQFAQVAQAVIDRVKRDYPGYSIVKHEIEQTPQGTFYEVEIEHNGSQFELYFDASANPVANANEDS